MKNDMKRVRGSVLFTLVFLFVAGLGGTFMANEASAQTRPALVQDVENPARTPFWGHGSATIPVNFINQYASVGTVPAGQRLVIEHVAATCYMDADDNISQVTIGVYRGNTSAWTSWGVPLVAQKQGATWDGRATWVVSQPVRLYSDGVNAGTSINFAHSKTSATATCYAYVSGHTITTP